jgi:MSHA biogenesis protein MshM
MYLEHYGLREFPFSLTPDTSFFFAYGHYRDAFNTLLVALQNGEGFIKVTGEVGTGKTLLCRKLLNSLEEPFSTAYIPNPFLSPNSLILALAEELGLELPHKQGPHHALKLITEHLIELKAQNRQLVLCIDEAQAIPEQTLETLRLITNLETEKHKLLHVVLFGQPELDERLNKASVRQIKHRITFSYQLRPIDRDGMEAYIAYRLKIAGDQGRVRFEPKALKLLYQGSGGTPRLINILAHKALLLGYGQGIDTIGARQIKLAIEDTEGACKGGFWQNICRRSLFGALLPTLVATAVSIHSLNPTLSMGVH